MAAIRRQSTCLPAQPLCKLIRSGLLCCLFVCGNGVASGQMQHTSSSLENAIARTGQSARHTAPRNEDTAAAVRGLKWLRTKAYLPPDFDDEVFDNLWKRWPEPDRSQARNADASTRRQLTFDYYGIHAAPLPASAASLTERTDKSEQTSVEPGDTMTKTVPLEPLGYVRTAEGGWAMNCFSCHGGRVNGRVYPGLPNAQFDLATLTEDVTATKAQLQKPLSHLDLAQLRMPLGTTRGTTNSVMFGVILGNLRDGDMDVHTDRPPPPLLHHDMDAPPWWLLKKKSMIYIDGHAPKTHRPLTQFMLLPVNTRQTVQSWEDEFRDILAYLESVEPPKWPFAVDRHLASQGQHVFEEHCSRCHGTYGKDPSYPERLVDWEVIRTDPTRLQALPRKHLDWMHTGWMSRYGKDRVRTKLTGYVAPPLDGVWASAPYFHNGSVPTLWHVLHPQQRPKLWKSDRIRYDRQRVGLAIDVVEQIPANLPSRQRRLYFDTSQRGKSSTGHDFPKVLTAKQKAALLEYLKTL